MLTEDKQRQMFGTTVRALKALASNQSVPTLAKLSASMLSDAQEAMTFDNHESARQRINRAKWILQEIEDRS